MPKYLTVEPVTVETLKAANVSADDMAVLDNPVDLEDIRQMVEDHLNNDVLLGEIEFVSALFATARRILLKGVPNA